MRALHLATRLAGTDGVSLEARKVAEVLRRDFGFEPAFCAGRLDGPGYRLPAMDLHDPVAVETRERAFDGVESDSALEARVDARADELATDLQAVVERVAPDLLVVQNAWAVPMHLPLARAVALVADATGLPCLSHEHDYPWERERFEACRMPDFLRRYFPYHREGVRHLCIHAGAREALAERRGLHAVVLPNVLDFEAEPPAGDAADRPVREAFGLGPERTLFLQPTRVVPRKGIELAVDLLAARDDPRDVLVIPHHAGDEGLAYLAWLTDYAGSRNVDLRHVADRVAPERGAGPDGEPVHALWDVYRHADFVTYPSRIEGFGNALLEAVWFGKPVLVNRYPVYRRDIAPTGMRFVEIDGEVDTAAARSVTELLASPELRASVTAHNLEVARRHFSLATARARLGPELRALGFRA